MLIALLAVLGVDLIVIVVLVGVLLTRRAWVSRQPGAFKGSIRVADGEVPGLRRKWKRGFGRWVGDVLVWTVAPFLFRNELIEADRTTNEIRQAGPDDKVRRVGSNPVIMVVGADGARIEVATAADQRERAFGRPADRVPVRQLDAGRPGRHERSPSAGDAPDRDWTRLARRGWRLCLGLCSGSRVRRGLAAADPPSAARPDPAGRPRVSSGRPIVAGCPGPR